MLQVGDVLVDQWRREMGNVIFGADFGRAYCGVKHLCWGGGASERLLGLLVGVEQGENRLLSLLLR